MKPILSLVSLFALSACITSAGPSRTIEECQRINDKNFRDRCIADALTNADDELARTAGETSEDDSD